MRDNVEAKLKKGEKYDESILSFTGWSNGEENESYNCWDYFHDGVYLGADPHGIEPLFDRDEGAK